MWNSIIGQEKSVEKLKLLYKSKKISHAYIFYGMEGTGKDAAAVEFAKLINCELAHKTYEACDSCESCQKISRFSSEYFNFICTLPPGKTEEIGSNPIESLSAQDFDNYLEQIKLKSLNPYNRINLQNANNIRINSIRNLVSKIYLSTNKQYYKVFLISEADKMRQEASNALLKVLEEPPQKSVIILTTSKINSLPPTIIGRCQKIYFEPLALNLIKEKLKKDFKFQFSEKDIELSARLSVGSYSRAVELLEIGIEEIRQTAINFLVSLIKDDYAETVYITRSITSKNSREKIKYFLFFLNSWFNDLLKVRFLQNQKEKTPIVNYDMLERLIRFNTNYPDVKIFDIVNSIEECDKLIYQNVHLPLVILNLSFNLKNHIKPGK